MTSTVSECNANNQRNIRSTAASLQLRGAIPLLATLAPGCPRAQRMIRLIVVFLMQTVVVPLMLWRLYRLTDGRPTTNTPASI